MNTRSPLRFSRKTGLLLILVVFFVVVSVSTILALSDNSLSLESQNSRTASSLESVSPSFRQLSPDSNSLGISIEYPEDWHVYDAGAWKTDNEQSACDSAVSPSYMIENSIILSRQDLGQCVSFMTWENWPGDFIIAVYDEPWKPSLYVLGENGADLTTVSGAEAVKYLFTEESELPRKQAARIYFNHLGKGYLIEFVQSDKQGGYDPIFDQVISSLTLP